MITFFYVLVCLSFFWDIVTNCVCSACFMYLTFLYVVVALFSETNTNLCVPQDGRAPWSSLVKHGHDLRLTKNSLIIHTREQLSLGDRDAAPGCDKSCDDHGCRESWVVCLAIKITGVGLLVPSCGTFSGVSSRAARAAAGVHLHFKFQYYGPDSTL